MIYELSRANITPDRALVNELVAAYAWNNKGLCGVIWSLCRPEGRQKVCLSLMHATSFKGAVTDFFYPFLSVFLTVLQLTMPSVGCSFSRFNT